MSLHRYLIEPVPVSGQCDLLWLFLLRFDELHYGKYAGLYMQNTFFFDSQPPFGKQLVALAAYIAGFDGEEQSLLWNAYSFLWKYFWVCHTTSSRF